MAFARAYELPTGGLQKELGCYDGMGSLGIRLFNPFRKGKKGQRGRKWMLGLAAVGAGGYFGGKKMGWWGTPKTAVGSGGPATYGPPPAPGVYGPSPAPAPYGPPAPASISPKMRSGAIRIPKSPSGGGFLKNLFGSVAPMLLAPSGGGGGGGAQPQYIPAPKASPVVPIALAVGGIVALAVVVNVIKAKKKG